MNKIFLGPVDHAVFEYTVQPVSKITQMIHQMNHLAKVLRKEKRNMKTFGRQESIPVGSQALPSFQSSFCEGSRVRYIKTSCNLIQSPDSGHPKSCSPSWSVCMNVTNMVTDSEDNRTKLLL